MGVVYLVGAGPGDPGLLTLRGARLLRRADVVIYDALTNDTLLDLIPSSAERIHVGKRGYAHHTPQAEINRLLIDAAGRVPVVIRLKGGDPFVFGRGGEEASALAEAGVPFEVVPGVTAAVGAAAYAGIPLTHRELSSSVRLVTGHGSGKCGAEWDAHASQDGTLVVYMGMKSLPDTAQQLIAAGRAPDTPAAVIEWGTYAFQRTVTAPLRDIAAEVERAGLGSPAVVVVGEVVKLRERLRWFEDRPLFGLRVLVPRSRPQPSRLAKSLSGLGAHVIEAPRVRLLPAHDPVPLRRAIESVTDYTWVVFTSSAAVKAFWREWWALGRDARSSAGVRFACFGSATAAALRRRGVRPDVALLTYDPDAAVGALADSARPASGDRVLFPGVRRGESAIAVRLQEAGYRVEPVEAYRQAAELSEAAELRRMLEGGEIDVVALSSSGTVRTFVDAIAPVSGQAIVAAMGPETVRAALSHGLPVHVVPSEPTLRSLTDGLIAWAAGRNRNGCVDRVGAVSESDGTRGSTLRPG